jgi:hypothetical protein
MLKHPSASIKPQNQKLFNAKLFVGGRKRQNDTHHPWDSRALLTDYIFDHLRIYHYIG